MTAITMMVVMAMAMAMAMTMTTPFLQHPSKREGGAQKVCSVDTG